MNFCGTSKCWVITFPGSCCYYNESETKRDIKRGQMQYGHSDEGFDGSSVQFLGILLNNLAHLI